MDNKKRIDVGDEIILKPRDNGNWDYYIIKATGDKLITIPVFPGKTLDEIINEIKNNYIYQKSDISTEFEFFSLSSLLMLLDSCRKAYANETPIDGCCYGVDEYPDWVRHTTKIQNELVKRGQEFKPVLIDGKYNP